MTQTPKEGDLVSISRTCEDYVFNPSKFIGMIIDKRYDDISLIYDVLMTSAFGQVKVFSLLDDQYSFYIIQRGKNGTIKQAG